MEQRVPLAYGRDGATESYKLRLKQILLEDLASTYLDGNDLRADWVAEVLARTNVAQRTLDTYVSRSFPRKAVLGGSQLTNDRARQLGAPRCRYHRAAQWHAVGAGACDRKRPRSSSGQREAELAERPVEPTEQHRQFADFVIWLAKKLCGAKIRVAFVHKPLTSEGLLEDACTNAAAGEIRFNVASRLNFDDPYEPETLGVILHELAHLGHPEHDHAFIDQLQTLAGRTAALLRRPLKSRS